LAHQAENVLANWHQMSLKDQRIVAHAFIVRIVVTPTGKHRVADVEIQWRDENTNTFVLPYRADKWTLWIPEEVERLTELLERQATQVEMAQALPERNWRAIRIKIYEIIDTRSFHIAPKVICDEETYAAYLPHSWKWLQDGALALCYIYRQHTRGMLWSLLMKLKIYHRYICV
jgi:hypothetical protein